MNSQSSSSTSTSSPDTQYPYDADLAEDLRSRIFVPPDALMTTILRLPKDWRTNSTAGTVIDVIRRDSSFQATVKGYIQASNGSGELDVPPPRLYDGMLQRVLELTCADEKILSHDRSHFLEYAPRDEWLDAKPQVPQKRTSPKADEDGADGKESSDDDDEDEDEVDEEAEAELSAHRQRMSIRCASMAKEMFLMLQPHSIGVLISPRKAQLLYYDRSVILIGEAFDILDTDDQPTDTLIAMLLGFSVIPPNSGLPSFLRRA